MDSRPNRPLRIWIVDPIDYSGMAYYDAGMASGLALAGADVQVVGTDRRLLPQPAEATWQHRATFEGTAGTGSRVIRGLRYLRALLRLLPLARRQRPDVIVWQYPELQPADLVAMRLLRLLGPRLVFVAHELKPWARNRASLFARHAIVRGCDLLIAHGSPEADALARQFGVGRSKVLVSEHGDYREFINASLTQAGARERLGLDPGIPIALLFGSLRASKGIGLLLDVWPSVRERVPTACLVIAGRRLRGGDVGPDPGQGVVFRSGTISPAEANDYYVAADVVAMPYDELTTSGVLRYAYSVGRPVVATDVGELPRHVVPGETGWVVPAGDRRALTDALVESLSDRARAAAMGQRARSYGLGAFDWATIGATTYAALRELVGR